MQPRVIILLVLLLAGCTRHRPVDVEKLVGDSSAILLFTPEKNAETFRLAEILKSDGSYPLRQKVGDSVRLSSPPTPETGEMRIAFVGSKFWGSELVQNRYYSELYVYDGKVPGLNGMNLDMFRALIESKRVPNQPSLPTTTAVTPPAGQEARRP